LPFATVRQYHRLSPVILNPWPHHLHYPQLTHSKCRHILTSLRNRIACCSLSAKVPTVQHVWYYGWLSALSTGLGSIPLLFWSNPSSKWLGVSNAIAAGMMFSASFSLVDEGRKLEPDGTILYGYAVGALSIPSSSCHMRSSLLLILFSVVSSPSPCLLPTSLSPSPRSFHGFRHCTHSPLANQS
jgi:hypothetical protein